MQSGWSSRCIKPVDICFRLKHILVYLIKCFCFYVCLCVIVVNKHHTHIHTHIVSDGWIDGWRGKEWDLWVSLSHSWWNAENDAEEFRRQKTLSVCVSPFSGRARKPLCPRAAAGLVTLLLISEVTADWEASARMQKFLRLCCRFLMPRSCWSVSVMRAEIVKLWLCQMSFITELHWNHLMDW